MTDLSIMNDAAERLRAANAGPERYWLDAVAGVRLALPDSHRAELRAFMANGPLRDGDESSKALRDDLLRWGLCARVMVRGQWGYTAATHLAGHVLGDHIEVVS